ncbi:OprO/OprP family phosphate-selective porin [Enterovibrio sp. ZSDZ35]|uniref:OprO/OprP family phosphate-selective porin n=1 Tax=Enterovibrio qingdaonensis TaxID=2899818 RepID=A0ABT5QH60_9GAMM|nr:porin [Enterovibrio sp. ZSDZ35]MDD1780306.1 OprO/OprP family phosphate-selective porin [Enterovibrio sp. ZSDZ35]
MDIATPQKAVLATLLSSLLAAPAVNAIEIYQNANGDKLDLYGEVGVGGHIGANYEYGEFYDDQYYVDDSFATLGVKGVKDGIIYRLELDYQRENWKYADGELALAVDKLFLGYQINDNHYVEAGLTDTAFDDYDKYGDFTLDTTVESGEAGDQDATVKYEGRFGKIKTGISYTYGAQSSSGSELGDTVNGYIGYFGDVFSVVGGLEGRGGAAGESKYGEHSLMGLGMRWVATDKITVGLNAFYEREDIAQEKTAIDITDPNNKIYAYNNYQTLTNKGGLVSAKYQIDEKWNIVTSINYEAYEEWDENSKYYDEETSWGNSRTWGTLGVNYKPSRSTLIAIEGNLGESAQNAYAYARVYF